jgi:hypothetical protein
MFLIFNLKKTEPIFHTQTLDITCYYIFQAFCALLLELYPWLPSYHLPLASLQQHLLFSFQGHEAE